MRWLLTIALVAVAGISASEVAKAEQHRGITASKEKDEDGRRDGKDQSPDRAGEKSRDKDSEKRMKEEMEREDERAISRRFGKSLRASSREGLPPPVPSPRKLSALQAASVPGPMGGILLVIYNLWDRYLARPQSALAAPAPDAQK